MAKFYRKKIVDAIQFLGDLSQVQEFVGSHISVKKHPIYSQLEVDSKQVNYADYLVKEDQKLIIYQANIFEQIFDKLN
jgi:hypothetical protein